MGEVVKVKPGYARNYLLPQAKAVRATKANRERFERERAQLEAQNLKRRDEAERVAERVQGLSVMLIRQASESGALYGSVSSRDIAEASTAAGLAIERSQVVLQHPIKALGIASVRVALHPEVVDRRQGERRPQPRRGGEAGPRRGDRRRAAEEAPGTRPALRRGRGPPRGLSASSDRTKFDRNDRNGPCISCKGRCRCRVFFFARRHT